MHIKQQNVPSTDEHLYKIIVSTICMHTVQFGIYKTSIDAYLWRASLLWRTVDSISVTALWRQCFIESTSNVSYVDESELGNWSKVMSMATMWQCFRVITCKAWMHAWLNLQDIPACTRTWRCERKTRNVTISPQEHYDGQFQSTEDTFLIVFRNSWAFGVNLCGSFCIYCKQTNKQTLSIIYI